MSEIRHSRRQRPLRVFFSHSNVDTVFARKLGSLLERRLNAHVFTAGDLSAGEKWETKLRNELAATDVFVALLTPVLSVQVGCCRSLEPRGPSRSRLSRSSRGETS
jgi:hypothetical protein